MKIKPILKSAENESLAIVIQETTELNGDLFSAQENSFIQEKLSETPNKWIVVNQYHRFVFIYHDKKEVKGLALQKENSRNIGAKLTVIANDLKLTAINLQAQKNIYELAEGVALGNYQFLRYFSDAKEKKNSLVSINILNGNEADCNELNNLVTATNFSKDLVNTPLWDLTAEQLAEHAVEAGKQYNFTTEVLNKKKIESLKMGGLLAVNKGSVDPPVFIIMEHKPKNAKNTKPLIFVGKGVVYDTGGLSLKSSVNMDEMKSDMGGSAAVIGAMQAIAANNLPYHVIGLVPATDNRPGGNAVVPGDVITISNGKTVEVMNTDAEGRLILSDALVYAQKYKPELVIDLATLTGAAAHAIGRYGIVAMGDAEPTHWEKAKESGDNVHERLVEFPFWDDYDELIESPIADLKNIGGPIGGAITAGKFLANFTDYPYIHLDIAGPAFVDNNRGYIQKGATGVGVRLLYNFVKNF